MPATTSCSLSFDLSSAPVTIKGFTHRRWRVTGLTPGDAGPWCLRLQLLMTERAAYRFNLASVTPRLFLRAGDSDAPEPRPGAITASQEVAAAWMDGEQRVLEVAMPLAIQAWIEAYLARHGEAPPEGRKKRRQGAGRAREMQP
ncbi:DUF3305 domain-containing protein [Halomonas sp. NCCP-2165]|nr:DUF3305 domain-containing protein [Halomonas sp. NCCP-2165]GKW48013.1 hypothetical protein NCCP2165_02280 [Halomonas sp. NCCP-2165]